MLRHMDAHSHGPHVYYTTVVITKSCWECLHVLMHKRTNTHAHTNQVFIHTESLQWHMHFCHRLLPDGSLGVASPGLPWCFCASFMTGWPLGPAVHGMVHTSMHQPHTMSGVDIRMWTLQTAAMNGWLATRQMMIIVEASLSRMW